MTGTRVRRRVHRPWLGACVVLALQVGCATYSDRIEEVRLAVDRGDAPVALERINDALGVSSSEELPRKWKADRALAVLERGVLLQSVGEFEKSARDLSGGEAELELLDLGADAVGQIGQYIYSDSAKTYRASPTERLALNGLNMLNYLALGDLSGAAVEARRFTNMREYLASIGLRENGRFGAYLSGFVFERLGEGDRALRYYEEALEAGPLGSLSRPVARLAASARYRGPQLQALLARAGEGASPAAAPRDSAEILVVFALGRVPHKVPERVPIGAAIGLAGGWITGDARILERSIFKVVVYPALAPQSVRATRPQVRVDGRGAPVEALSDLGVDIAREYELIKPRIFGAALSRMIVRAAAAEGMRVAGREAGGDAGELIGLLVSLLTEGSLVTLDRPDTRSWTLLPDRISVARIAVRPGDHELEIEVPGVQEKRIVPVRLSEDGFAVVVVTIPR